MALGVRKSVLIELAFTKLFNKIDFLDLANFVAINKFSILLPTLLPLVLSPTLLGILWLFLFSLAYIASLLLAVVQSIEVDNAAILLKFLINVL